jgi:hypothetical protein
MRFEENRRLARQLVRDGGSDWHLLTFYVELKKKRRFVCRRQKRI